MECLPAAATSSAYATRPRLLRRVPARAAQFPLGFMKPSESFRFGHSGAFGAPGAGGSMGYADPQTGIGYGYVTNRMGTNLSGDPRDIALRAAIPELAHAGP
jgi:CubicO group peptidase (beta-lactamase class C family)